MTGEADVVFFRQEEVKDQIPETNRRGQMSLAMECRGAWLDLSRSRSWHSTRWTAMNMKGR